MQNLGINNLDIYLTGKCNFACRYCYGENEKNGSMNEHTFSKCIDFAKYISCKNIEFCGGEPLVAREFEKYAVVARNNGFKVILRTNGMLIDKHLKFIAENCDWVGISIDGLPHENAVMRLSRVQISEEEQFLTPIKAICELKNRNQELRIVLATVVSKKNYLKIQEFANYLIEKNIPINEWKIYEFIVDKFRSVENQKEFELTEQEFLSAVSKLPKNINGAKIIAKSAHSEKRAGDCLIVKQNGDIDNMGVHFGNVAVDDFDTIIDNLKKADIIETIIQNKNETYSF